MRKLIKLRYRLNKEYFFSSSVILKDISEQHKKLFYGCYLGLKSIVLGCIFFIIAVVLSWKQAELYFFDTAQVVFFLVCAFYFSSVLEMENGKTRIKDFLLGANFNHMEKSINRKKAALLVFFEASIMCTAMWLALSPMLSRIATLNLITAILLSIINLLSVLFQNYYSRIQSGSKYWFMQYVVVGVISFGIIRFWHFFTRDIHLTAYGITRSMLLLMVCGILYQGTSIFLCLRKKNIKNQSIGGLSGDFIEKYLSHSAVVYAIPIVLLNMVPISQLAKALVLAAYISLFVMPNVMSLKFLNYYKMVGNSRNVLVKYGKLIFLLQIVLALLSGFLCGVTVVYLLLMSVLLAGVTALRIWLAILLAQSKHEDSRKTDYYAVSMFVPVLLLAAMAFFWR